MAVRARFFRYKNLRVHSRVDRARTVGTDHGRRVCLLFHLSRLHIRERRFSRQPSRIVNVDSRFFHTLLPITMDRRKRVYRGARPKRHRERRYALRRFAGREDSTILFNITKHGEAVPLYRIKIQFYVL